jgi:exopolyphosphatase/guanosine-5'-triphosphate,3'-diphosphate pyrophosphatase
VVGFIDLGTNSIRLLLIRINRDKSYTVLIQRKETVRLGEGSVSNEHYRTMQGYVRDTGV